MSECANLEQRISANEAEMKQIQAMHIESMRGLAEATKGINELAKQIAVQNESNKNRDEQMKKLEVKVDEMDKAQRGIITKMAENKFAVDMIKSINNKAWALIVTGIGAAMASVYAIMGSM